MPDQDIDPKVNPNMLAATHIVDARRRLSDAYARERGAELAALTSIAHSLVAIATVLVHGDVHTLTTTQPSG